MDTRSTTCQSSSPVPVDELLAACWLDYPLAIPTTCHLLQDGFNTHYSIATPAGDYVLRVYRHGWRTADDIAYELAALAHLEARDVPVCAPIARRDGAYQSIIPTADGLRIAVLFPYAHGKAPDTVDAEAVRDCGRVMALIHRHTDDFHCEHRRFHLDLDHLLAQPYEVIRPMLTHRSEDLAFVCEATEALHRELVERIGELEWGYCHGDFHGGNLRRDANRQLRVFDFDCGGPGWRAYDLSVCRLFCGNDAAWEIFCRGYEEIRPITVATQAAIPWFLVTRQLWRIVLFAANWSHLTGAPVDDAFFDQHLSILRERINTYLPQLLR